MPRVVITSAVALWLLVPLSAGPMDGQYSSFSAPQDFSSAPDEPDAWADDDIPAHVSVVDGNVSIERDGRISAAEENTPLLAGDRVRTDRGRVSILYADGTALDVDQYSSLDLLSESLLRLNTGRVRLALSRVNASQPLRVDGVGVTASIRQPGEYRVTLGDTRVEFPELTLATLRGAAELISPIGRTLVRAGTASSATARTEPSLPWTINVSSTDEFDRWIETQRNARVGYESSQHLPDELQSYSGSLETTGDWQYEETYGYVWYPIVPIGWRPYYDGRWSYYGGYGWTWIGAKRWAWPTHHYGRWGYGGSRWFWIPHNRWSPAWVSWAYAPGYVSWCPLGFDNRPVFGFGGYRGNPYWGWTISTANGFTSRTLVRDYAVTVDRVPDGTWSQFGRRSAAPRPSMTTTNDTPLRAPSVAARGRAIPRGTAATPLQLSPARAATPRAGVATAAPNFNRGSSDTPYTRIPAPAQTPSPRATTPASGRTTDGNRSAQPRGAYAPATPSSPSNLPTVIRGTPPAPRQQPTQDTDSPYRSFGTGRVSPSPARPAGGTDAPPTYSPPTARPRSGGGTTASPSPPRSGAPATAAPARIRSGAPAQAGSGSGTATRSGGTSSGSGGSSSGAASSGRTVSRGRGGL